MKRLQPLGQKRLTCRLYNDPDAEAQPVDRVQGAGSAGDRGGRGVRIIFWATRFGKNTRGSLALKSALVLPAVLMMGAVGFDLIQVQASKNHLQDIANSAARAAADDHSAPSDANERARTHVESELGEWGKQAPTVEGLYEVVDVEGRSAIQVVLKGRRPSLFANLLPPGGWRFVARSSATIPSMAPEGQQSDHRAGRA
uniref:Putative Flp pilus-assembly TadG-like N-terminal domain-containing protein n=1 Tax=Brevundimonas basaltis TaxID=472166 RepID=A0A7W8MGC6_9CAUL|nr:hypothetical protein [Brevundimonas basaltis]